MIDIEKEREAFESLFKEKLGAHGCQFDLDSDGNYDDRETVCAWHMWQAAKAHEAKKLDGCVVVPVEPTQTMIDAMEQFDDRYDYADMRSAYKAMVEAARGENHE